MSGIFSNDCELRDTLRPLPEIAFQCESAVANSADTSLHFQANLRQ